MTDAGTTGMNLRDLRDGDTEWRIAVLSGPGVSRELRAIDRFDQLLDHWALELGVRTEHFGSNHEGRILEFIHASTGTTHGYLVNPGGLTSVGESLRHALRDAKRPAVEVHLDNGVLNGGSIFAPSVTSVFSGLQQFSYLGALVSLVLSLDDADFLGPGGTSASNRSDGSPRSLFG
jgi:3-dehydroquinate dehydratase